ncbi:hypothetical protein LSHI6S_03131 [Leifsonia shinshuensis]
MSGFAGRGEATGTHDELVANTVVIESGNRIAVVCCDLLFLPRSQVDRIRRAIEAATGIRETDIVISTSHNHYGPVVDDRGRRSSRRARPRRPPTSRTSPTSSRDWFWRPAAGSAPLCSDTE